MAVLRALVVEDSPTQAFHIRLLLEADGFEVATVSRLSEAIERLGKSPFDVVALDLMLPDSSGLEGLDTLVASSPTTPIVVLTAHTDERMALDALGRGAEDYLSKSQLEQTLLVRTMRYAIERHRSRAELQKLTMELRVKNGELGRLVEQKNRFLGIAAHDLRNPLGVILGYSELLLSGDAGSISDEQAEILSVVNSSVDFMLGLINDLLDISMIEAGALRLDMRRTDLMSIVRKNISMNRVVADKKHIQLVLKEDTKLEPIDLDRRKIEQVLNNLISNAVKFSHPRTVVEVRVVREGSDVVISVKDQGVGIPRSEQANLFRPFQKTSARSTAGERSTGLGLAIVRIIVEGHEGRIWVESEVGRGSTFYVALPVHRANRAASSETTSPNSSRPSSQAESAAPTLGSPERSAAK